MNLPALGATVTLLLALIVGVFATPLDVEAQQTSRIYRLGFLYGSPVTAGAPVFEAALVT